MSLLISNWFTHFRKTKIYLTDNMCEIQLALNVLLIIIVLRCGTESNIILRRDALLILQKYGKT